MDRTAQQAPRARQRRLGLVVAGVVLAVGAVVAALTLAGGDEPPTAVSGGPTEPSSTPYREVEGSSVVLRAPSGSTGRCAVPTAEALARVDLALEGTVAEVDGARVLLEVTRWYAGDEGTRAADEVELRNPTGLRDLLGGVPDPAVGDRLLVAASGGTLAVCGFTAPWSEEQARLYAEAFGS